MKTTCVHTCACMYLWVYVCLRASACVCMHAFVCACVHVVSEGSVKES